MRTVFLRPRDKKIAKNTAKTALLATAALAMPYAVTPSPLTVACHAVRRHSESSYRGLHRRDGYGPESCLP
jgi:hypothetical protein